jgi:hypothetical protein
MSRSSAEATKPGVPARYRASCAVLAWVLLAACGGNGAAEHPLGAGGIAAGAAAGAPAAGGTNASAGGPAAGSGGVTTAANGGGPGAAGRPVEAGKAGGTSGTGAGAGGASGIAGAVAAAAGAAAGMSAAGNGASAPSLPPVTSTSGPGPFETMQDLQSGPKRQSGVFRPSELGKGGLKHPIFVWGCGGGSTPSTYAELMNQVASHGFVVIAEVAAIGDNGAPLTAAIDWLIAEAARADSPLYQKLDTSKIALGGHSIGSANSFLVGADPRLTTTIHVAGGSIDMPGDINAPTTGKGGKGLVHPVAYICSQMDQFGNVEKTELDYMNTTVPAWMTVMTGVDHVAAARQGLPAIIAWLRWQLAGESERRAAFLDPGGEFNTGKYVSKNKNW